MNRIKVLLTLLCLWLGLMPLAAQSVKIINELELNPFASALALYKNEFGSFENHALDIPFPYAVIRMHLEGSGPAVRQAKERMTLDVGQMFRVESRVTTYTNQIVFLVKAKRLYMLIDCGDGCEKVVLNNMEQLQSNAVYDCTVQFTPEGDQPTTDTVFVERGPKYHNLNLHVKPNNATVEIVVNKERRIWTLEDGQLPLQLLEGDYDYTISATGYYSEKGTIHIPANPSDTTIRLLCQNGRLSIVSDSMNLQGLSASIMSNTGGKQIVPLPIKSYFCVPGTYYISIMKPDYQIYKRYIVIKENDDIHLSPYLIHKRKIQSFDSNSIIDLTDKNVLISGTLPNRYATETGLIYGITSDRTQGVKIILNAKGGFEKEISNLEPNTEYFVWAYAYNEIDTIYSDVISFRTLNYSPFKNGHRYVDLGLSVKWATCNVGAETETEHGEYFAWGETQPKEEYVFTNYKWCDGSYNSHTKYCTDSRYGTVDNKTIVEAADDAATVNWGGNWRMPTEEEVEELLDNCTWKWTKKNGVNGYLITSKINGNIIFIPATGIRIGNSLMGAGKYSSLWMNSLYTSLLYNACNLSFSKDSITKGHSMRYIGLPIRPVFP